MAAANYFKAVQEIYIAYYQRPADPAGLRYWAERVDAAGGDTTAIINAFATSAEASSLYGDISKDGVGTVIDKIYQALFGRTPDEAGKAFYEAAFKDGTVSAGNIAIAILNAAREKDVTAIENKVAVANSFTQLVAGREFNDPAFGTDDKLAFDYTGNDAAAAARQLLTKVTADTGTVLDKEDILDQLEGGKTGGGHGGGAPAIKAFTVADAIAASNAETLPKTYKLVDTLAHLTANDAAELLENAHSYSLADVTSGLGFLDAKQFAFVEGAANQHLYQYGKSLVLTGAQHESKIGSKGDDKFTAHANTINAHDTLDGAGGNDILDITGTGDQTGSISSSALIRGIETINFLNQSDVEGSIDTSVFAGATAIWQNFHDTNLVFLDEGQLAGFRNTDANILLSYRPEVTKAIIGLENVAPKSNATTFDISGEDLTVVSVSGSVVNANPLLLNITDENPLYHTADTDIETIELALTLNTSVGLKGNLGSLTKFDASKSEGDITVDFQHQGNAVALNLKTVLMGSKDDKVLLKDQHQAVTIDMGNGNDTVIIGTAQSGHVIITGAGSDTIQINSSVQGEALSNIRFNDSTASDFMTSFEAKIITIKDFDAVVDKLIFGQGVLNGQQFSDAGEPYDAADADTLFAAVNQVAGAMTANNQWAIFEHRGHAYVFQNNGSDTDFDAGDGLVRIENISVSDLELGENYFITGHMSV